MNNISLLREVIARYFYALRQMEHVVVEVQRPHDSKLLRLIHMSESTKFAILADIQ